MHSILQTSCSFIHSVYRFMFRDPVLKHLIKMKMMVVSGNEQQDCVEKENNRTKCRKSGLLFSLRNKKKTSTAQPKMMRNLATERKQSSFILLLLFTLTTCVPVVSPKILDHQEGKTPFLSFFISFCS